MHVETRRYPLENKMYSNIKLRNWSLTLSLVAVPTLLAQAVGAQEEGAHGAQNQKLESAQVGLVEKEPGGETTTETPDESKPENSITQGDTESPSREAPPETTADVSTQEPQAGGAKTSVESRGVEKLKHTEIAASDPEVDNARVPDVPPGMPLVFSTSMKSRFEMRESYDALGVSRGRFQEGDQTVYRARIGLRSAPLDLGGGLTGLVQFTPQASGAYGVNGTVAENNVGIYEGYLRFSGESLSFDAGRFMMDYGDALVVGNLDWHQTARSFDGVRARFSLREKSYVDTFITQATPSGGPGAEGHPGVSAPLFGGDSYFWGVYAGLGAMIAEGMDLDLYLLGNSNVTYDTPSLDPTLPSTTTAGATQVTVGARVKDKMDALDYRVEVGAQMGTRPGLDGAQSGFAYQGDAEVGFTWATRYRVGLSGALASGDDPTTEKYEGWNELYPTGHKWLGLMDITGSRTNVVSGALHLQAKMMERYIAKVEGHVFSRLQEGGLGRAGGDNFTGGEIDAQFITKLGKAGKIRGLYGLFIPNSGYYAANDLAHYVELEAALKF